MPRVTNHTHTEKIGGDSILFLVVFPSRGGKPLWHSSSTTEGSKERSCESNGEQEKNTPRDSTQDLEQMFVEQNERVTTLIEEHNSWILKRRRTLGSDEAWRGQTVDAKNGNAGISISQDDLYVFLFGSGLGSFIQVICLFKEWVTCNLFRINGSWPCWKSLVLSFSLLHLHHAYLHIKNAYTHLHVSC